MTKDQENSKSEMHIYSNQYFVVRAIIYSNPTYRTILLINRRDTQEGYGSKSVMCKSIEDLVSIAESLIDKIEKPIDWKAPHRYCIAYYGRLIESEDDFSEFIRNKIDISKDWWEYLRIRLLKESALTKKVNKLSFDERKKLITLTEWEVNNSDARVIYGITGRDRLYKRLIDKSGLESTYRIFKKSLNDYLSFLDRD